MDMVEKVAKAIYEARNGAGAKAWPHLTRSHQGPYIDDARAAIAAMREPTEAMIAAGDDKDESGFCDEPGYTASAETHYRAMIDAALLPAVAGST